MAGLFVGAAAATLVQYARLRERRLLPLSALFAFVAAGIFRGTTDAWGRLAYCGALLVGLLLMLMLSPRARAVR